MSAAKHTPGPWLVARHQRSGAHRVTLTPDDANGDICNVLACLGARTSAEVEANAYLIAAAPELLEALEYIKKTAVLDREHLRVIDAAVARATGGAA